MMGRCPPVPRVDTITGREKSEKSEHVLTTVQQRRRGVGTMGRCWDGPRNGRTVRWSTTACGSEPNATHKNNPMTAPPTPARLGAPDVRLGASAVT